MPRLIRVSRLTLAVFTMLSLVAGGAFAQRKPDVAPRDDSPPPIDIKGFTEAYQRAEEPQMIVMVGIVTGGPRSGERNVAAFDPDADSDALRRQIEMQLLEVPVELIEQSSLDAVKQRELNLLGQQDEGAVMAALKEKFDADVAIKIEMQPRGGDAKYRVTVDLLSVTRGRKMGTFFFDWKTGDDARSIKALGDQVIRKTMEQFVKFYGKGGRDGAEMKYTVQLIGVEDNRDIRDARDAFEKIDGVSKVRARANTDAQGRKATTFEVTYQGTMLDLQVDLEETASDLLGLKVGSTDANSGTITLIAGGTKPPPPVAQRSPCEELFDESSQRHDLFKERYKAQGRPRVTILINREVFKGERQNQEHAANFKFIGPPPGAITHPLLVTATAENSIADYFKKLGVRIVNADQVRQRIEKAAKKAGGVMKDDELLALLKDDDVADIVILGRGGTVGAGKGIWYTFEATKMGGDNLGNTRWTSEVDGTNLAAVDEAFELLGHDVCCDLSLKMMAEWKGNQRLDVVVTGAKNSGAVYAIMDELKKGYDGIVEAEFGNIDGGKAGGTARFSIEYTSSYEDLARKVSELAENGKFAVESSTREGLVLRAGSGAGAGSSSAAPKKPVKSAVTRELESEDAAATEPAEKAEPATKAEPAEDTEKAQ
jgi:hypothetical protein